MVNYLPNINQQSGLTVNKERPVNLDLTKFHFPPMAILSILHRISGVLLFLLLPLAIYLLHKSLVSSGSFSDTVTLLQHGGMKLLLWVMISATLFHLVAGIRHLVMDFGFGETLAASRISAYLVFALVLLLFVLVGVWLW